MNDDFLEKLSALVDGELNEFETRQLLRQLDQMPEAQRQQAYASWQGMQNTSNLLQEQGDPAIQAGASNSFAAGVIDAIANESHDEVQAEQGLAMEEIDVAEGPLAGAQLHSVENEASSASSSDRSVDSIAATVPASPLWSRFAVAATVALAVIVGVQQYQLGVQEELLLANSIEREQQIDQTQMTLLAELQAAQSEEEQLVAQQRLMDYLQTRKPARLDQNSADPFARVANFADEKE